MLQASNFQSQTIVLSHHHTAINVPVLGCELRADSWNI